MFDKASTLIFILPLDKLPPLIGIIVHKFSPLSSKADRSAPGGAETVAVFTALVRCGGTLASTLLLLRSDTLLQYHFVDMYLQ